ncbi:MAG TPA: hypothetical protein VGG58_04185, partial [Candidatus Acidoferrum sp.]
IWPQAGPSAGVAARITTSAREVDAMFHLHFPREYSSVTPAFDNHLKRSGRAVRQFGRAVFHVVVWNQAGRGHRQSPNALLHCDV